jgi:hypothetical protein
MFMGLELIRGVNPLRERLVCPDALLDVELVALAREVPNPCAYPQRWTMSLLITEHERRDIVDHSYQRVAVRSCIATFVMHKHVSMSFWPQFRFGFVSRFRVIQEARPRGQTALLIKLEMDGKGRLSCHEMALQGLEEISCAIYASPAPAPNN